METCGLSCYTLFSFLSKQKTGKYSLTWYKILIYAERDIQNVDSVEQGVLW